MGDNKAPKAFMRGEYSLAENSSEVWRQIVNPLTGRHQNNDSPDAIQTAFWIPYAVINR